MFSSEQQTILFYLIMNDATLAEMKIPCFLIE